VEWQSGDRSNIEDMRGRSGFGAVHLGIGGVIVVGLLSWATGTNWFSVLGLNDTGSSPAVTGTTGQTQTSSPAEEREVDMVDAVAGDVQDTWTALLGARYQRTRVVLFRDSLDSACGTAQSATGPFYCPEDRKVYLDLAFFNELSDRFGAPGDFARAYVIAHEIGHHVQTLLGLMGTGSAPSAGATGMSVAIELQADCFAGVWAHAADQPGRHESGKIALNAADIESGLRAAASIGDDRLQKLATGRVMPERFTHGTSAQRVESLSRGLSSGSPNACIAGQRMSQ
jgi:uncharacterized protein